jgi:hypothetical protein
VAFLDGLFDVFGGDGPFGGDAGVMAATPSGGRASQRLLETLGEDLAELRALYANAAAETVKAGVGLDGLSPDAFRERMADLARGLVIRILLEITGVDWSWSAGELAVGRLIFEHLWGRRLKDDQVEAALEHLRGQPQPQWEAVVQPFVRLPAFREHRDELLTLAFRIANLIAKADGRVTPEEHQQLSMLRGHLDNLLRPIKLQDSSRTLKGAAGAPPHKARGYKAGAQALQTQEAAAPPLPVAKPAEAAKSKDQQFDEAVAELNRLIGLRTIKDEVRSLMNFLKLQRQRAAHGLPETKISLHSVFNGNPGTGKTTVARLMGKLLGALGILAKGHLVETDRSGLVAEYAGQTGPKTNKRIDEAQGGVLFIDEAYSLVAEKGDDPYGQEAVQTLLKRMEDDRERLVVILAGYPKPMDRLLRSNPGLQSRFNRFFHFPDYSWSELCQIMETLTERCHYVLPPLTRARLILGFRRVCEAKDEHFGNARLVRNLYEKAVTRLADRIAGIAPLTKDLLTRIEPEDLRFDDLPADVFAPLDAGQARFTVICAGCGQTSAARPELLGRHLKCKICAHVFAAPWGELVVEA